MIQHDYTHLTQEIKIFFKEYSATLLSIQELNRDNFERFPAPGDGLLQCFTAHVLFHNIGIFGNKGDYLNDVFPRMITLRTRLTSHLKKMDSEKFGSLEETTVEIAPYADPFGIISDSLPPQIRPSRGQLIIPSQTLARSSYYASLIHRYGDIPGVVTNNGTVVGPDGGLITAACRVAATFKKKISVMEFGSGGGSTALALSRQNKLESYYGIDFSSEMVDYFHEVVIPQLKSNKVQSTVLLGSCFDIPLDGLFDLISVGVSYQAQPSLFEKRGHELIASLNKSGVLIIQTGMLEDHFVTQLLSGSVQNNRTWPWYKESYHLNNYFHYIAEYIIDQEIVLIATNDQKKFQQIGMSFQDDGFFRRISLAV